VFRAGYTELLIRVYCKMFGVGIDHLDLKSVHSLMQPIVLPAVVNVSSLWDVCMATCTRPNWSGFMQTVCVGKHESPSQINESQNTDAQGTRAPTTTLYVLCGLQEGIRLCLP